LGQAVIEPPETKFVKRGDDHIAYQNVGEGPPDLLWITSLGECLDARWDDKPSASFIRRLASFSRLIMFDRRGVGASDPVPLEALPVWEGVDDALTVLDAVGSERATVLGASNAGPAAALFAATRPERTQALILANSAARFLRCDDYPWGMTKEDLDAVANFVEEHWGTEAMAGFGTLDQARDPAHLRWQTKAQRMSCSPKVAATYMRHEQSVDVRPVLSSIQVPTLVLHRKEAPFIVHEQGRQLAEPDPRGVVRARLWCRHHDYVKALCSNPRLH
jgi:pimeloyl-ACP methyl ester carboxylesterase